MDNEELIKRQSRLGWTSRYLAEKAGRCEQTVCNWRKDRQKIPTYVDKILSDAEREQHLAGKSP